MTGNQSFTIPITHWKDMGATFDFNVTYNSVGMTDPSTNSTTPKIDFARLSKRNSKWSHSYAQWIELVEPSEYPGAPPYAVWHRNGTTIAFPPVLGTEPWVYYSRGTGYVIEAVDRAGSLTTSVNCNGQSQTITIWPEEFRITDGRGTVYSFTNVIFDKASCTAVPHYLLTKIEDRYKRTLEVIWNNATTAADNPRVRFVKNSWGSTVLTFNYNADFLLTNVVDLYGHQHQFTYTNVKDENGADRKKLSGVIAYGTEVNPTVKQWSFLYRDPVDKNNGYSSTYTGDLVIQKTDPSGHITRYNYEPVNVSGNRPTADDWDGRISSIEWSEKMTDGSLQPRAIQRVCSTVGLGVANATMIYPGDIRIGYEYSGWDLVKIVEYRPDLATGTYVPYRRWSFEYDGTHNLTAFRTPMESDQSPPLVQYDYTFQGGSTPYANRVKSITARYLKGDGTAVGSLQGDGSVQVLMAAYANNGMPTQYNVWGDPNTGIPHRSAIFEYDNLNRLSLIYTNPYNFGGQNPTVSGQTYLYYDPAVPGTEYGLPSSVKSDTNNVTTFQYDYVLGELTKAIGPANPATSALLPDGTSNPDASPSSIALSYSGADIAQVTDAEGSVVNYYRYSQATPEAVAQISFSDGSYRYNVIDYQGKVLRSVDEHGVKTDLTYNSRGQVLTICQGVGTPDERWTRFYYDSRGDLRELHPPSGAGGKIRFEYERYDWVSGQGLVYNGIYEGKVTRVLYADGSSEYFGYNLAGEPMWTRKPDGSVITLERDAQHRVTKVSYPAVPGNGPAGFDVTYEYDVVGQLYKVTDNSGTTTFTYDKKGRVTRVDAPSTQKSYSIYYNRLYDIPGSYQGRWETIVSVDGVGNYVYREDNKGRITQIINPFQQAFNFHYDRDGKNVWVTYPNGTKEKKTYNGRDWLTSIQHLSSTGATLDSQTYLYTDTSGNVDRIGRIQREVDASGNTHSFSYDAHSQLIEESHPDFGTIEYQYDVNGNRIQKIHNQQSEYYGYDALNRLLWINSLGSFAPTPGQTAPHSAYNYDANGQPIALWRVLANGTAFSSTFQWDAAGNLVQSSGGDQYNATYNWLGSRVRSSLNGTSRYYSYGHVHSVTGGITSDKVYTGSLAERKDGVDQFVHRDWLGSARHLTDASGQNTTGTYRYDAFGNISANTGTASTDYEYAGSHGYASDAPNGLLFVGSRYYDPVAGRFLSPDPIGIAGGLNLYAYAGNNPVNFVDPQGTSPTLVTGAVGAVGGAFIGGAVAWWNGENVWVGAGRGAVIGGVVGLTGGAAGGAAAAAWSSSISGCSVTAGIVGGTVGGIVGDAAGQLTELGLGWRCQYDPSQTLISGLTGGITGGIAWKLSGMACFPAGTLIQTREGEKPIEEIRVGDVVLSADPDTGVQSYQKVVRTFVRQADELIRIEVADGRVIEATAEHPFWVESKGFVAAKRLARSDLLRDVSGQSVQVARITSRLGEVTVYNFEVENTHTYYAGGWWVHNQCQVPVAKFRDYIFKTGATHGKDTVFRSLGYGAEHSDDLVRIYTEQGAAKFARGEYTLGKLDHYGQRINIEIELPGIGSAAGKTSYLNSGWMIRPDGGISLNTPFSGFTR